MALETNELFSKSTIGREFKFEATVVKVKTIDGLAGGPLLKRGRPMAFNTSTNLWEPFVGAGLNGVGVISGFLYEDVQTSDSGADDDEVQANMMLAGEIDYRFIESEIGHEETTPAGDIAATAAELKAALRSGPRALGITITGLDQVR